MKKNNGAAILVFLILLAADGAVWFQMFGGAPPAHAAMYFLDVGQGDSQLLELPGGVHIMTDAGPDSKVVASFDRALAQGRRSIDIAIVSHPELDHFNGYNYLIDHCRIGAFIVTGRDHPGSKPWADLMRKIRDKNIPLITLGEGDGIRYGSSTIAIFSPGAQFIGRAEYNDTAFVQKVNTPDFTVLLTADTGINVEEYLLKRYSAVTFSADILKVGHHGSKYSSGSAFLRAVHPALAVIQVGAHNTYGHPTPETLARLAAAHIPIIRNDQRGNITVRREGGKLIVSSEK